MARPFDRQPEVTDVHQRRALGVVGGSAPYEEHALYLALADKGNTSRQAVGYISGVTDLLRQQGIALEIYRIRPKDLRDQRVLGALRRRGIDRLPAVLARGRPLVGLADIRSYYEAQLSAGPARDLGEAPHREPERRRGRDRAEPERGRAEPEHPDDEGSPEADLDAFFHQEMHGGGPDHDLSDA
jgi:hypothetical protein